MAATLASLWEKRKKVQPNSATSHRDHNLTEDVGGNSQATAKAFQAGESSKNCSTHCQRAAAPVSSDRQTSGPEKKRKRAQLSVEQDETFDILQGSNSQLSAEDTKDAARKAEQLETMLRDQHNADSKGPLTCAQSSQVLGPDKTDSVTTKQVHANAQSTNVKTSQQVLSGQTNEGLSAAAHLGHNGSLNEISDQAQASSKQELLKQHQSQLAQCMQQAQAMKPMADLPLFIDGQLNRAQVRAVICHSWQPAKAAMCLDECIHAA